MKQKKSVSLKTRIPNRKLNKGTNAGGKNTNLFGKKFEDLTNIESTLFKKKFKKININNSKYGYYFIKNFRDKEIIFTMQNGLKLYMKKYYDINLFRCPDEAYIINYRNENKNKSNKNNINKKSIIKILEKKEQNVDGSVETKLWCGPSLKREYEIILEDKFVVNYAFCLSSFLQDKIESSTPKYNILEKILKENFINILYGENKNYFKKLYSWICK